MIENASKLQYKIIDTGKNIFDNTIATLIANIDELEKDEYRKRQLVEYSKAAVPSTVYSIINMISKDEVIKSSDITTITQLCQSISNILASHSGTYWNNNGSCKLTCQNKCQTTCQISCQSCHSGTCHDKHCGFF